MSVCSPERLGWQKAYRDRNRDKLSERKREFDLQSRYGLTSDEYDELLDAQGGVCAICENECPSGKRLAVDHDHETGEVRGLLCAACNRGVGMLKDDPDLLRKAAAYLEVK